jgi:hypothetical protein
VPTFQKNLLPPFSALDMGLMYQTSLRHIAEDQCYNSGNAVPVTRCEGPYGCERSRIPHFLDSQLTDGSEVVSLTYRPPFIPRKIPGTHFC